MKLKQTVIAAGVAGFVAGASFLGVSVASATSSTSTSTGQQKIAFCHRTGSDKNPYVFLDTSPNAIIKAGHGDHTGPIFPAVGPNGKWGDIIPPFKFTGGFFPGLNWPAGASIVANGCHVPGGGTTTTSTTQPEETTTTQPQETTTTQPGETTTTLPNETTTTTLPGETTTTLPGHIRTLLSLRAIVIGGPATPADFDLTARGPVDISGVTDNPRVTRALVDPGTYALGFIADRLANDPYTNNGYSCVGSADFTTVSTTLDAGEAAICTIVFTEAATTATTVPGTPAPTGSTPASSGSTAGTTTATTLAPGAPITAPSTPAPGCPAQDPQCPTSGRGLG